ncbi:zinc finger protein 638-like [Mastacembelus armatus]|uniref:zinc finger protein 638-like n=1 Tax=Mastacembelus armatus TaxID=205130 RepID=UPI000E4630C7|nr:zinc finger protein 638-like [Mastacembelus armatus]XP_026158860.1 zinc finger protein 638-like [Mastacembelus armatus]
MYHHHSQQQGPQSFSNGTRPPHHQQPPNQHQNRTPSDMRSQVIGFQFPRPTQLPDELESALAIRGARDMDHRLIDHINGPNQHQNQASGSGITQCGSYNSNPITLPSDNQPGHQQPVDWSSYQPPTKLFASPPATTNHQSQRHQGPQQQPQSSHTGSSASSWTVPVSDSQSPQTRHPLGSGSGGSRDGQGLYTPESAGSILASFGLSNEDLEVLSHYPDDQLTPDTLPFILRDIQINKSSNQKTVVSTSSSSFLHDMQLPPSQSSSMACSQSPEVPSLLTVTQTAGKVIDYGHASRAKEESSTRETFKREPLSSERTVKLYPSASSSTSAPKSEKAERRQVNLEHNEPGKHGDQDYRRTGREHHKSNLSPGRELCKSRNLDKDYRHGRPKPRPSSDTQSEDSSRRSLSSSGSKPKSSSKKFPTPTMISDFSAVPPKVYPHTCSLCHINCDQEKDWVDHINTVNHTAACRDLRNKYPNWKPNLPRGSRALWDTKDHSRSLSSSSPSPPNKHRVGPHLHRPHGKPHHPPRHHHYTEHGHRLEHHHSASRSPTHSHQTSSSLREHWPEKRERELSGGSCRGVKRPHGDLIRCSAASNRYPFSSKSSHSSKHGPSQSTTKTVKSGTKPGTKIAKMSSAKATDTSAKPPPAKKKKKTVTAAPQDLRVADRLVYLTGIPNDASEQEVTDLVGSFGQINNVILMPCSEEESKKREGQKASVCMVRAEDAQALANSQNLSIKNQQIAASTAKKPEGQQASHTNSSKTSSVYDKVAAGEAAGRDMNQNASAEKGTVLITELPESGWSESDIIKLVQPFGTPSDIILATEIGKVLVSVPNNEIAQEMVKVHTLIPMKIKDTEVKMIHLKQRVDLSTPVALYNLVMGPVDPLENPSPVGWSRLVVIGNVPNTPSGSSEVQKLVRRFGTVIKTLVLNNMVICEMATAAMALSVYKRFQTFPCIIQNNPLFFSRKPDPKTNTQSKVVPSCVDSSEPSVCMVRAEDSQALTTSITLLSNNQQIAASTAKKPEGDQAAHTNSSKTPISPVCIKVAAGDNAGSDMNRKASAEKGTVLITELPESGWSESDIIKLVQPFGTPSDIILATEIGKVLVSVPNNEIAQEMVKVHTLIPMKIKDTEVKMIHLKQRVDLSTPVALYNLIMGPVDPLENPSPVGWSRLVVIGNVPNTPSGSSEVQKLVRRFGTVIKTLVLNNMVICEMATAAMALSVYKRFQTFPCIIQNNPLFFSRKPDPKTNTQSKVVPSCVDSSEPSVCMVRAEDSQALTTSITLLSNNQQIAASTAKKPEEEQGSHTNSSKTFPVCGKVAAGEDAGGDMNQKASAEKGTVLITELPECGWSESDIIKLVQPFGTPSDIILATEIGKVLVSVPNNEIAQEMVKVHTLIPVKIKDTEVKMIHLKQRVDLSTPVALYNLVMGPVDPLENPSPVGWSRLVVIGNVPNTPSGSSEVQKLVRRFGTVVKTLVLNNMVICEMATAAMALSVYKRFQTFPCIIQNNPLFFSRKPDPKTNTQSKVISSSNDSSEDTPANGKGSQSAAATDEEKMVHTEKEMEKIVYGKEEKIKNSEKMPGDSETLVENGSKDKLSNAVLITAEPTDKPEADVNVDVRETSAVQSLAEAAEKGINASQADGDKTPAGEDTKLSSSDDKAASSVTVMLPEVTQEMVKALIVECRTRTASNAASSTCGAELGTEQGKKAAEEAIEPAKNHSEEIKKREKERNEREARKEKEAKEKERKERERKPWEKEERYRRERERDKRSKREREKREDERREWERRERERRERKRVYGEGFPGSRSSCRLEGYKQSSWRDECYYTSEANKEMGEEEEDFPFNMGDFVTVDEVGDVTDLPYAPSPPLPMETTEAEKDTPTSSQENTLGETSLDTTAETVSDATATLLKSDEQVFESEAVNAPAVDISDGHSSDVASSPVHTTTASLILASQADSCSSQTLAPTCQAETETTPKTGNPSEDAQVDAPLNNPTPEAVTAENKEDKKEDSDFSQRQPDEKMVVVVVSDKPEHQEKMVVVSDKADDQEKMMVVSDKADDQEKMMVVSDKADDQEKMVLVSDKADDQEKMVLVSDKADDQENMVLVSDKADDQEKTMVVSDKADDQEKTMVVSDKADDQEKTVVSDKADDQEKTVVSDKADDQEKTVVSDKADDQEKMPDDKETGAPAAEMGNYKRSEDQPNTGEEIVKKKLKQDADLPPFDPSNPVGMEFLVPKTGFFCKVCNRFFSGGKEAEINHCKTVKHYKNLQEYLQTMKPASVTATTACS